MAEYKFDIFKVLERLSVKDREYFLKMTEEDKKAIQPLVLMRWMSGTSEARQVFFLNEIINPFVFPLNKHKQLLLDLLEICGSGKTRRYIWNKAKNNKKTNTPKSIELIKEYYGYSTLQAKEAMTLLTDDDIMQFAWHLGKQPDEIKLISKELKSRHIIPE